WEKILWRRQPYPDNHVPSSFLSELRSLPPRPKPPLFPLILAALPVTQHLAVLALFIAIFHSLLTDRLTASQVGWGTILSSSFFYFVHSWGWGRSLSFKHSLDGKRRGNDEEYLPPPTKLRPLILPPLLLSLLSPVLGTLTSATTSDSIWPLAGGLLSVHLLLGDFSTGRDARLRQRWVKEREKRKRSGSLSAHEPLIEEKSLTSSLSFTSGLSGAIVLASRLPSTAHVFSLVLLAVALFAGWPRVAKSVRESGQRFSLLLTISTLLVSISFFPTLSPASQLLSPPTLILLGLVALINFVGPAMLCWGWRWKTVRGGGWEPAVVNLRK
ncbi:hypothetical protein TREMEDRAFT_16788, partial [Tremella mesenterica DSM 1558]|uniref:uncharacterized protein n=1 Tax=Tremella mesenterica (strain ATCC 24925 / CBS 8224 / DSM 1558 / NBRC 9311 / NRRL Y-6157 / RJB 2259-6 / UBC 559-6) TaxID=578456 RepID=UPI0003F49522